MVHAMADVSPDSCEVTLMEYSLLGTMTRCTGALTLTELKTAVLTFLALALIAMTAASDGDELFHNSDVFVCY